VDKNAFDVRGSGWTRHQHRVACGLEPGVAVSLMQVADDACRIEQDDEVLGKIGQRVHLQLLLLS
jgi:hypothetical protein